MRRSTRAMPVGSRSTPTVTSTIHRDCCYSRCMKQCTIVMAAIVAIAGCGKKGSDKDKEQPTPVASIDAAATAGSGSGSAGSGSGSGSVAVVDDDPAAAEETARRKDKKTGLGAPDEKPDVIVEDLVR